MFTGSAAKTVWAYELFLCWAHKPWRKEEVKDYLFISERTCQNCLQRIAILNGGLVP